MSARGWFERLLDSVADHGIELLGRLDVAVDDAPGEAELCHRLVDGVGEASNVALAREILQRWESMDDERRLAFLKLLAVEFDPDPEAIAAAAADYRPNAPHTLRRLLEVSEPPRQDLIRRLNMAPGGTATLVAMRAWLLGVLRDHPDLRNVDADFQHLLASWFNRGFLRLERIDWNSPAAILEKLIRYEAVHPMAGWDDLRRRLQSDRRCFAFFHPALPQDPLIFVEVALTREVADTIAPLTDPRAAIDDTSGADTAVFYSINNALAGLRGVSFGNFLIKQVVTELRAELPQIATFVTLSPIPRMRQGLRALMEASAQDRGEAGPRRGASAQDLLAVIGERAADLSRATGREAPLDALDHLIAEGVPGALRKLVDELLRDMALFYLASLKRGAGAYDPVAHFHLSNGARLERINVRANTSERGRAEAWGCMVNYRYLDDEVVANHEAYAGDGRVTLGRDLDKAQRRLNALMGRD